jgi:hypothetical protein
MDITIHKQVNVLEECRQNCISRQSSYGQTQKRDEVERRGSSSSAVECLLPKFWKVSCTSCCGEQAREWKEEELPTFVETNLLYAFKASTDKAVKQLLAGCRRQREREKREREKRVNQHGSDTNCKKKFRRPARCETPQLLLGKGLTILPSS